MNNLKYISIIFYNLAVIGAFLYTINSRDLSMWWMVLGGCLLMGYKTGPEKSSK